jgi:hypothetical protein
MASNGSSVEMRTLVEGPTADESSAAATSRTITPSPIMFKDKEEPIGSWLCAEGRESYAEVTSAWYH